MKVLFVANLFPNCHEPFRGIFNFRQITHLAKLAEVRVIAPIEWFFIKGKYAPPAPVPDSEEIDGLKVVHPRNFYLPKIGVFNPWFFARAIRGSMNEIRRAFPFDVIYVNWTFPDGCGVARIARKLGVPFVASVSGSDANSYLKLRFRRGQILRMFGHARAVTVRSRALKTLLESHGVPAAKVHVLYNGVDREQFSPQPRAAMRKRLGLDESKRVLLYVGHLRSEKGIADLMESVALLREHDVQLVILGDGPERAALREKARTLGLDERVAWAGRKRPEEIAPYLSAADLLCLPSHMEGVPNVALEAFACGLPVVGTAVGGIPEIITETTGLLGQPHDPASFAAALTTALHRQWNSVAIRAHAANFDWNNNARQLLSILQVAAAQ